MLASKQVSNLSIEDDRLVEGDKNWEIEQSALDDENDENSFFVKWKKEVKNTMEIKFKEFLRRKADKSLRWDFGHRTIEFDAKLKEKDYWELRFEVEYDRVINEDDNGNRYLVADIHAYVYYVTDIMLLGSHDYPDEKHCLIHLREDVIYYNQNWNYVENNLEDKHNQVEHCDDVHLDGLTMMIKDKIENKFKEFQRKKADKSLCWDFGCRTIKFDDNLNERDYWVTCFEEQYDKVINNDSIRNLYLLADIHAYIFYVTGNLMLGSRYFDEKNCLKLFEQKIIYYNR